MAAPRFATPRNLDRGTYGPEAALVAKRVGFELMPWQQALLDLLLEHDDDGQLWYRDATILTPRQSAKSTTTKILALDRALNGEARGWGRMQQIRFTAQTAMEARSQLVDTWFAQLEYHELEEVKRLLRSNGREAIEFVNGARISTFPPSATGGHGQTVDLAVYDEAFAAVDDRVEQGIRPALITRSSPQFVVVSTAGTAESVYLLERVERGRTAVLTGEESRSAYVEFSAGPELDIDDPETWPLFMPALGHTITVEALEAEHAAVSPELWARAYANRWVASDSAVIPAVIWQAAQGVRPQRPDGEAVYLSLDVAPGPGNTGRTASFAVAWWQDDLLHVDVVEHGAGLAWVPEKVHELTRRHDVRSLTVDTLGPVAQLLPDITRKSAVPLVEMDARTVAAAAQAFHQSIIEGPSIIHHGQDQLDAAVIGASQRKLGDGWAWKRSSSKADISPLVAATNAAWTAKASRVTGLIGMYVPARTLKAP